MKLTTLINQIFLQFQSTIQLQRCLKRKFHLWLNYLTSSLQKKSRLLLLEILGLKIETKIETETRIEIKIKIGIKPIPLKIIKQLVKIIIILIVALKISIIRIKIEIEIEIKKIIQILNIKILRMLKWSLLRI